MMIYFYSLLMTSNIVIFATMTALAPLHALIITFMSAIVNAFALGLAQKSVTTFEVSLVMNSLLITVVLALIS